MSKTYDTEKVHRVAVQCSYIDPFDGFSLAGCTVVSTKTAYVSGSLDVIRLPNGFAGQWIMLGEVWFRRLDAQVYLWLRGRVRSAIEAQGRSEELTGACQALEVLRQTGIETGAFTETDVSEWIQASPQFVWWDHCPRWAEGY